MLKGILKSLAVKLFRGSAVPGLTAIKTTVLVVLVYLSALILIPEDDITTIFPTLESMWSER